MAVSIVVVGELTVPAETENVADVWPCGIATLAGALITAGDELIPTEAPPISAGEVSETVQLEPAAGLIETGLHDRLLRPGICDMETVPPLTLVEIPAPVGSADMPLAS